MYALVSESKPSIYRSIFIGMSRGHAFMLTEEVYKIGAQQIPFLFMKWHLQIEY